MDNIAIKTAENGDVIVACDYCAWTVDAVERTEKRYTAIGRYVYRVFDNGHTEQACERLLPTGPTLMLCGSLEETIRNTLA